jgi:acetyl-CoA C-acetyltransferase
MPPAQEGGTVTAGNASPITDGAGALVLMSYQRAQQLQAPIMAVIRGCADANQEPEWFTTAPAKAVPKVRTVRLAAGV